MNIFDLIFFQPIYNLLIFIYDNIPNIGIAIIIVTLIVKLVLYPLNNKTLKSQKKLQGLHSKIKEIQDKYKDNKEKAAMEIMELYKKEGVNPFSSCLPMIIQLPFIYALYKVFQVGFETETFKYLYPFITKPESINTFFLGINMSEPSFLIALLAGIFQFLHAKQMTSLQKNNNNPLNKDKKDDSMAALMGKQMTYILPFITIVIGMSFPAGLVFYWLVFTIFSIIQHYLVFKNDEKQDGSGIN